MKEKVTKLVISFYLKINQVITILNETLHRLISYLTENLENNGKPKIFRISTLILLELNFTTDSNTISTLCSMIGANHSGTGHFPNFTEISWEGLCAVYQRIVIKNRIKMVPVFY